MKKEVRLLECTDLRTPEKGFVIEYQKSILFSMKEEGILNQVQMEMCLQRLKQYYM